MSKLLSWGIENSVPGAPEDKRTELVRHDLNLFFFSLLSACSQTNYN